MKWKYFVGACILTCALLLKFGAPIGSLLIGVLLAAVVNWKTQRRGQA